MTNCATPSANDQQPAARPMQMAEHAERISVLDTRESAHHQTAAARLERLADLANNSSARLDAITSILDRHATVINTLDGLDHQVAAIASHPAEVAAVGAPTARNCRPDGRRRHFAAAATATSLGGHRSGPAGKARANGRRHHLGLELS